MAVGVVGAGAVGTRAVRQLAATAGASEVLVADADEERARRVARAIGGPAVAASVEEVSDSDVVVLATPAPHAADAERLLRGGASVVSVGDDLEDARSLLALGPLAEGLGRSLVVGAAFAPGLSSLLARHIAARLDDVDEIHVALLGTGGPACARQHHRALGSAAVELHDGAWRERPGGSGRELCWFPEPLGAHDCYRAGLSDPVVLAAAFPGVRRLTARTAATRRDRLTAWLPMLRPPHREGGLAGIRVEVRGQRGRARVTEVLGAVDRAAVAAGAVAAVAATQVADAGLPGAFGLADARLPTTELLASLARRGVKAARFVGTGVTATW